MVRGPVAIIITVKPVLILSTMGQLWIEVKIYYVDTFGTSQSGLSIEVVSEYRWSLAQVSLYFRASKHMRIRILICENQHQYAKNLKNMQNNDFAYWYSDITF